MENVRRWFGISSMVMLAGFVVGAAACSDSNPGDPGGENAEAGPDRREGGNPQTETAPPPPEEKTVGKPCAADADCEVPNSVGDNVCSIGFFTIGDLYADSVCVSPCIRGPGTTVADILCDGDETGAPGVCNAGSPGAQGVCLPACAFDSTTLKDPSCAGSNKCAPQFFLTASDGAVSSLGICLGGCTQDADCKGSPGQKCQAEIGLCVNPDKHLTYAKAFGDACNAAASVDECNCAAVGGTGANKDKGYCTTSCVTGAAGDTACNTAVTGWKCSAGLPVKLSGGEAAFTGQPDGILGQCAQPCTADGDCTTLATTIGGGVTAKCEDTAGFKVCVAVK